MATHFDLCIVGTGSGNSILDERFDGWSVAIVERGTFGGTCLNVGCIPSKMLIYPADIAEMAVDGHRLGVNARLESVDWPAIRDRTFGRIDPIAAGGEAYRRSQSNVEVFADDARFVGPGRLEVGDRVITADRWVIAAGARTVVPDIEGLAAVGYQTSDTIMRIESIPPRLLVIGSGFVATEMSHVFGAFGSQVSMVVRGEWVLSREDEEIRRRITERFDERFDLHRWSRVTSVTRTSSGIVVEITSPRGDERIEVDEILVAVGRIPNGGQLNVEAAGVELDGDGYVMTDLDLQTGVPGVWALGDVRNPLQLKHVANHEARIVAHNMLNPGDPKRCDEHAVPHAVFTHPQIGSVGLTEEQAVAHGRPFVTKVQEYGDTAYGWAMDDSTSAFKVIVDIDTRLVIGAHAIGPQASILIQPVVFGMQLGHTVDEMATAAMYPHPALSEVLENALLGAVAQLG